MLPPLNSRGLPTETEPRRVPMPSYGPCGAGSGELALCIFVKSFRDYQIQGLIHNYEN